MEMPPNGSGASPRTQSVKSSNKIFCIRYGLKVPTTSWFGWVHEDTLLEVEELVQNAVDLHDRFGEVRDHVPLEVEELVQNAVNLHRSLSVRDPHKLFTHLSQQQHRPVTLHFTVRACLRK